VLARVSKGFADLIEPGRKSAVAEPTFVMIALLSGLNDMFGEHQPCGFSVNVLSKMTALV
jgi:hypothetical protein